MNNLEAIKRVTFPRELNTGKPVALYEVFFGAYRFVFGEEPFADSLVVLLNELVADKQNIFDCLKNLSDNTKASDAEGFCLYCEKGMENHSEICPWLMAQKILQGRTE